MKNKKYEDQWQNTLEAIKKALTKVSFDSWIRPLILKQVNTENNIIYFEVLDPLIIRIISERYLKILEENIRDQFGLPLKAVIQLPSSDTETANYNNSSEEYSKEYTKEVIFNPKYTFENFVVGEHNKYAHAAAYAVAQQPSTGYNPLFIYGGSGLGKTHLMHAIGCYIMENHPEMNILYVSAEMFTNELIDSIIDKSKKKDKRKEFKNKYRNQDILLIDDVQFIEGKEAIEEELFHTFNALYDNNKQIVLSSDRPPNKLTKLDERLRSRFAWNMVADIQPPDIETRIAILRTKAILEGIEINDEVNEVINYIAERVKYNVRDLEGHLLRLNTFSKLMEENITIKFAKEILKDLAAISDGTITPEKIKNKVAFKFNIKVSDLESSKRTRNIAFPRQIAMYLCREMTDLSFPKIGEYFGGRDHTTVMHAHDKIDYDVKNHQETEEIVNDIIKIINE